MATFDAIAFLGDTLIAVLQKGLAGLVDPANVLQSTPADYKEFAPVKPAVTLFLYHISVYGEMRNARPTSLQASRVPPLPLELRYLITPWTQKPRDSHRIAGAIAQTLYQQTRLGFSQLIGTGWAPDDSVEILLESVPVSEHYEIWEPTDLPYRLSLTYLARLVAIDATPSEAAPPVLLAALPGLGP
ncbi:MAG: DUF4255 domain-containing protein [Cyanobacteriota bacterium]|jgi:hypothetical protein|nr:DUF4255 domain-containing protein [Cyanobacteriota bacterium]